MFRTYTMELSGRLLQVDINRVAEQANGACLIRYGDTVILCTATASEKPREGIDFFPLSIDYEERLYSVGKIPGGFIKREGRPTEKAVLTSRVTDRPLRPLFPKDYRNDVSVVMTVLSVDQDASPEVVAMLGASIALSISDIPFYGPVASVIVGKIDGSYIINPSSEQKEISSMLVTVSSTKEKVMMIEAQANEVPEDDILQAIMTGHEENKKIVAFIEEIVQKEGKEKHSYEEHKIDTEFYEKVVSFVGESTMENCVFTDEKQVREKNISDLKERVKSAFCSDCKNEEELLLLTKQIDEAIYQFQKETVRRMILREQKRPDGRKMDEIRALHAEIDVLPRTHGSALFARGQTQVLTITTLGAMGDVQRLDGLDLMEDSKRYMHHYNFPAYSVGESRPPRGPGRREIGHGALAEKALLPVIPSEEDFPYAIRLVSEVLSSNGSTSQASVCGSTLSLMAAGVPILRPVAGISVGMVTGKTTDEYVLLTDIQGLEDFFGDMDFKVAGTKVGVTAIQMDMKIDGLTKEIIRDSLYRTKEAREYILDEVMLKTISEPKADLSPYAPRIVKLTIDPEKISDVIGARGKTIKKIIDQTNVQIDIEDDGSVFISGIEKENIDRAVEIIKAITEDPTPGNIYSGVVTRIMNFGAFVEFAPDREGLVHISKIAHERVNKVEDILSIGDSILVKVLDVDQQGRINLSRKDCLPKPEKK